VENYSTSCSNKKEVRRSTLKKLRIFNAILKVCSQIFRSTTFRAISCQEEKRGLHRAAVSAFSYVAVKSYRAACGTGLMDVHKKSATTALILLPVRYSTGRITD
jgi:hypothetical protein